jgi:predicted RNase H-like HicB family nuclease
MATTVYTAIIEKEGNLYAALCPELDVASQGATVEEATSNLREAVELFLESADAEEIKRRLRTDIFVTRIEAKHGWASGPVGTRSLSDPSAATDSSRCAGAEVISSCNAAPTPAGHASHPRPPSACHRHAAVHHPAERGIAGGVRRVI